MPEIGIVITAPAGRTSWNSASPNNSNSPNTTQPIVEISVTGPALDRSPLMRARRSTRSSSDPQPLRTPNRCQALFHDNARG